MDEIIKQIEIQVKIQETFLELYKQLSPDKVFGQEQYIAGLKAALEIAKEVKESCNG